MTTRIEKPRIRDGMASLKGDLLVLKWMAGLVLALQIAIVARLFMH